MKNLTIAGVVILLLLIGNFIFNKDDEPKVEKGRLVDESITITTYTSNEELHNSALVSIPFLEVMPNAKVNVALDVAGASVKVVSGTPTSARKNWSSGFYFETIEGLEGVRTGTITVDGKPHSVSVVHKKQNLEDLIDTSSVDNPEEAMLGIARIAHAQEVREVVYDDVTDINQKPSECGPTSAANSLIDLVKRNEGETLGDPAALIEELKGLMKWNLKNGVLPDNFVDGKNAWAEKHDLPIVTTKVGDSNGETTIEKLMEAMDAGAGVELRIKLADANKVQKSGHMVTVTGYHTDGEQVYLDVSDPFTEDSGTETIEIRGNRISNYGPWNGYTILSWGFVQTWTAPEEEVSEGESGASVEDEESKSAVTTGEEFDRGHIAIESTFSHVKPGEYSEIYVSVTGLNRGQEVTVRLSGGGHTGTPQVVEADSNGVAHYTYRITQHDTYDIHAYDIDGNEIEAMGLVVE